MQLMRDSAWWLGNTTYWILWGTPESIELRTLRQQNRQLAEIQRNLLYVTQELRTLKSATHTETELEDNTILIPETPL